MKNKPAIYAILAAILIISACVCCYVLGAASDKGLDRSEQLLHISATDKDVPSSSVIPAADLGGNYSENITYNFVQDVKVRIGGRDIPLETAIRDGLISVEEIFAFARIDAGNGFCAQRQETKNGLTVFTFRYDQIQLRIAFDVFRAPSGKEHLINLFSVEKPNTVTSFSLYDGNSQRPIDYEDWGLEFSIQSVNADGMTLICKQSNGQQNGSLFIESYTISTADGEPVLPLSGSYSQEDFTVVEILPDENTEYTINWTDSHGKLPSGAYTLRLTVHDSFDPSVAHPLMQNFRDYQVYYISFVVE